MLKTKIKAGQLTNLTDARYFAAWDVAWLGFCLTPHAEQAVSPAEVAAIKEWVEGPQIVGEFGLQAAEEILGMVTALELDAVQLDMFVGENVLEVLDNIPIIKEVVLEEKASIQSDIQFHIEKFEAYVDTFIFIFDKNGISYSDLEEATLNYLHTICQSYNVLLSIEVAPNQLDELLERIEPLGLHVKGGAEEKVGYKSFDELDDIFEALETFE